MAKEAERLLDGTGWLPEPLRMTDASEATSDGTTAIEGDGEALPEFLADDDEEAADELDEPRTRAAE